ncbi:MAG: undecaprenyl-phosphate glucose phosphotransferase [Gammaproteobacteria bacterium 28-57-27]|nr:MAG: undecaprenyl-phosphate glucose phosphotransferase [Gammaproteobacteria bacterium 28-57-27]
MRFRSHSVSTHDALPLLIKGLDAFVVALAGVLAYLWRFGIENFPIPAHYTMLMITGIAVLLAVYSSTGVYRSWRGGNIAQMFVHMLMGWMGALTILLALLAILKTSDDYSRLWLGTWAATTAILLLIERSLLYYLLSWLRLHGKNHKQVILIGHADIAHELIRRINSATWTGFDVIAIFDDQAKPHTEIDGVTLHQNFDEALQYIKDHSVSEVWITLPLREEAWLHTLRHSTANIRYVPDIFAFRLLNHGVSEIAGIPMLDLSTTPMTGINRLVKALEDRVLALLILITISPLLLGITLAVKMSSPGPVLFKQKRHGWDGREITVYKFRSMFVHQEDGDKITQARASDTRITPLGAFLRRTSLDELPQFFNVLQGRMSIVGPRPHALAHNEHYKELIESYMLRHKVKPGITGWAQVNGYRGETDTLEKMQKRIEYDLYYIEHWSLALDLKIILLTLFRGFKHPNAY